MNNQTRKELLSVLPISLYGQANAKSFDDLIGEVLSGESEIIWEKNRPIRLLRIAVIKIFSSRKDLMLVEDRQVFPDGRIRHRGIEALSEKLHPEESPLDGAKRALVEELQVNPDEVELSFSKESIEEKESPSYPGLLSRYEKHEFVAILPAHLHQGEYCEPCEDGVRTYFRWKQVS